MRQLRMHTRDGCVVCADPYRKSREDDPNIVGSVGRGGANRAKDVREIQKALNEVPPGIGGANPLLVVDGLVGTNTIRAIEDFQRFQFPEKKPDGRIDVDGEIYTLPRLKDMVELTRMYGRGPVVVFWQVRKPLRLARARATLRDVHGAVGKCVHALELAMDAVRGLPDFTGARALELRRASLHFKLDGLQPPRRLAALGKARDVMIRARIQLETAGPQMPGIPYGEAIFEIDPLNKTAIAYSPRRSIDPKVGVDPYRVYLCESVDTLSPDGLTLSLAHEMFHSVDDETPSFTIGDHGYRHRAFGIPHELRMANAENYAIYAMHVFLGRTRLVADEPRLAPHVPDKF